MSDRTPDRNLALELVRVTEAAALAAGRWMGRGDKEAGDQAAVDAMRLMLTTVDMDGIVVIGEGEKDEAPMLFNGEVVGTGQGPKVDVAVDPVDGTRAAGAGPAQRARRSWPSPTAARCSTPARSSTWTRSPWARRPPASSTSNAPVEKNLRAHRAGQPQGLRRPDGGGARPAAPREADRGYPRHRRPHPADHRRRRRRRDHGRVEGTGIDVLMGIGGTPGGRHLGLRAEVPGRRRSRAGSAPAQRRRAASGERPRLRPRRGCSPSTTWSPATTSSSPPPASPTASC